MKKLFFSFVMCFLVLTMDAQTYDQYVDLGLPSGTLWKTNNESGLYSFDEGTNKFGNNIPTREQWRELLHSCLWIWTANGCMFTGVNGNSIYLPSEGHVYCGYSTEHHGEHIPGWKYWTSSPRYDKPDCAYSVVMGPDLSYESYILSSDWRCTKRSIRLVQNRTDQKNKKWGIPESTYREHYNIESTKSEHEYVDLGLPSGTLWKSSNEKSGLCNYYEANKEYGNKLPTKKQWKELLEKCTWTWNGKGYVVKGSNGESIFLQTTGWRNFYGDGSICLVRLYGAYWTSLSYEENAWGVGFNSGAVGIGGDHCYSKRAVRLVKSR